MPNIGTMASSVSSGPSAWLLGTVGSVTTPDPGPLPSEYTFVFEIRGPISSSTSFLAIAAQSENHASDRAFLLSRRGSDSAIQIANYTLGTVASVTGRNVIPQTKTGAIERLAVVVDQDDNGTGNTASGWVHGSSGWQLTYGPLAPGVALTSFDSSQVVRIGRVSSVSGQWDDRIYMVELRTGLNPAAGTVLWRFDAAEYPGSGLSYVDPRGRTWTLSTTGVITSV